MSRVLSFKSLCNKAQPDGKFKWMLAVGSLDQYAEGTWWKNGGCIGLKPEAKFKKDLSIFLRA